MKALVPFNHIVDFKGYKNAGASEFYMGFSDPEWEKRFGDFADINRLSGFKDMANCNTFEETLLIIKKIKKEKLTIFVTFNSSIYSEEQLKYLQRYMRPLREAGVDGIIVSCPELVIMAKKYELNAVISTIAGVYNSDIARYYEKLDAKRIILPRDLSIEDIERITNKVPDMEYEVFMMRNGCIFSDANCLGLHRRENVAICTTLCNANSEFTSLKEGTGKKQEMESNHKIYHKEFHASACGLCSIYRFVQMGITAGKIVGRAENYEEICEDIRLLCQNVSIAKTCTSESEYLKRMILPSNCERVCSRGLNCYYPEIRF